MKKAKFIHLISLLLTLYMILGILPMSVFAATGSDITVEETQSSDTSEAADISNAQNENVGIEVLSDIQSGNNSDVATIASTSPTTKYFSIDSTNCHLKYSYNGQTNTRVSAAFTIRDVTDMNNSHNLSFLGDAVFCTQHFNKTPADRAKFVYVGKLSETEIKITDDLTADKAYRIIKAAQAVLKEDSRYQDQLNVRQLIFGVQQVLHSSESLLERLRHGVANEDFTASQAKLFGEYYKAIYDKFHTSTYYNMPVPTKQSLTADVSGGMTRSEDNYILAKYTLNMDGVTARVNSSGSTSGVTASVSGKTLTISIPASKMPTSGSVSYSISLTAANQSVEFVNLYTSNVDGKQSVIMLEEEYYTATKTVSGSVPIGNNGSVTVTKVDAENTEKKLSGAYFIISDKDRGTTYILGPTDSSGTATKNLLPVGRYTITESVAPDGYARSTETYSFEVTAGGTNTFSYTFKDTPVNQEIKWAPKVYKMENYGNGGFYYLSLRNEDYTFELLQDDVVIQTAKISSTYDRLPHFDFEPIVFTKEDEGKTFHFTVREQNDGQPGVVYSTGYVNYTIKINDVSVSVYSAPNEITTEYVGVFTWSNYQVSPIFLNQIPTGSWTPMVSKEISSDTLRDETFTFALYENGEEIDRNTITGSGTLTFDTIYYTADDIGTHTYTIREIAGTNSNIHYDSHEVTFVVDVSFDPNKLYEMAESSGYTNGLHEWGTLDSSQIASSAKLTVTQTSVTGNTTFTNVLNKTGNWTPQVTKQVTGNGAILTDGQFTFALYDENGELLQMVKNDATGKVTFAPINFTMDDVGTHTYTVEEWTDGQDGWIYDTHTLTYTVKVTEGTSSLTVTPTASGSTTFENKYETIKIRVEKEWNDNNNANGRRQAISFVLYGSNGNMIPFTLPVGQTSYEVTDVPKYNLDGTEITYTLVESEMENYTPDVRVAENVDGYRYVFHVTNTELTDITVTKVWNDQNQTALRKDVELTLTGSDGQTYTGTIPLGETTYTFKYLPVYKEDGQTKVEYTLSEAAIDGYSSRIVKDSTGYKFTVTNTPIVDLTEYTVHKKWVDNDDQDGIRPKEITVTIKGSDGNTYTATFGGAGNDWSYTFENLPMYDNGVLITYSIESENTVPDYTLSIEGSLITNTHTPGVVSVTVTKIWADNGNQDGLREDVQLTLTGSDGSSRTGTIKLGDSTYTWSDLPVYYNNGTKIEYTLIEATMDGYSAQIAKGADGYTFVVTNTHEPKVTDVTATKIWADNENQDGLRADVNLTLIGSDGSKRTGTIKLGETAFKWTDLPIYMDGGKVIVYTLTEAEIDGYESEISKSEGGYTFVVTNTHVPEEIEIPVRKVWEDHGDEWNVRPANITIVLYGSDGSERMATVKGTKDEWNYTFTNLPKYFNNGELIEYTLEELPVHGYTTEIERGDDGYTFAVTNTLVYGRLHITKTAEDGLVEGPHFRIHGVSHQGTTVDLIIVTGADGVARADYILPGYYYVDEVDVPDRYVTPAQQTVIVIGDDSDPEITVLPFYNELKRMSVVVNKTAEDGILSGHRFKIEGTDYLDNKIERNGVTDENGVVVFDSLLAGDYVITEIDTDIRYVVPENQDVTVTWGQDESVSFQNVLKRMSVTINKTAEDGILAGHKFRIVGTDYLGNEIDRMGVTDENGVVVFDSLLAGDYVITEVDTDIRYVVPENQDVTVTWGQDENVSFQNTLKHWRLTVRKTDATTYEPVAGAVYGIYKDGILIDEYTTDENGTFTTKDYLCGEGYTLKEISPAPGYTLDATEYRLVGTVAEICIEHLTHFDTDVTDTPTHVVITKTDVTTGQPVPGAEIVITDADGNEVFRAVTDENGQIEAFYLPVGIYTFTETVPASGYTLNPNSFTFEIREDGTITGDTEFTDEPTHVVITKTDITTSKPLPGAEITIYDAEGNVVYKAFTDENGQMEAFYLPVGVYTFKETAAPDGYKLNTTVFCFEIHADGTVTGDTEIEDEPHRVVLDKKDKTSKAPVVGAVIEVYDADGNRIGRYTTNENGKVAIVGIKPGTYTYKEIEAPAGYVLDGTVHTFVLHEDGTATGETTFENAAIEPRPPKTGDHTLAVGTLALISLAFAAYFIRKRKKDADSR